MLSEIPRTNSMTNCRIGWVTTTTPMRFPSTRSTRCSRLAGGAEAVLHVVSNRHGKQIQPIQSLRRNDALDLRTSRKAESEKLPLLRSRHRTLRLVYLELEPLRDELRDALHHPLPRPLAANVDVTVVRVTNEPMAPALQLPSSSSSTRLLSSGESGPPCGVPSTLGLTNPFSITPAFKKARMSFSSRLSSTRLAICPISLS